MTSDRDVLAKFFAMLEHMPEPAPLNDPRWRTKHVGSGQVVEVIAMRRYGAPEVIGTFEAVAADPTVFKLADGRAFGQRGGGLLTRGKKSPICASKVNP
jgi:hypothetical protein